ncbi:hypothetical protein GIB67_010435 [Kingdonia uniflora]|uniref:Uncharacterized protein n=1 Tax=Kingdonia uniflora TaxID=39325 RepID=A0A7J7MAE5_9MAGN|nr:hypothetical protein GIB67_010435 [Kingdonia uniflora]
MRQMRLMRPGIASHFRCNPLNATRCKCVTFCCISHILSHFLMQHNAINQLKHDRNTKKKILCKYTLILSEKNLI